MELITINVDLLQKIELVYLMQKFFVKSKCL